jgi:hypothetical protein
VVVFNADLDMVEDWRAGVDLPDDVRVVADPEAQLYRDLGTERQDPITLVLRSLKGALNSAREGIFAKPTRADMLRLGADVAVDADGDMVLLHRATGADDRLPTSDLLAALDGTSSNGRSRHG